MKEWLSNAQLVQKADLERIETRLDEVLTLIGELEARLKGDDKPPPPRP